MMNNLRKEKTNYLKEIGCVFVEEGTDTIVKTKYDEYVGLADLGKEAYCIDFIYKHKLTNLMGIQRAKGLPNSIYGCNPVSIGFNEEEQKWYGWTHRGYGSFGIGYEIVKDSIMDFGNHKYPFVAKTLDDCLMLAIDIAEYLN